MEPRIVTMPERKLVGMRITTSAAEIGPRTQALWSGFGPRKNTIAHRLNTDSVSLTRYPSPIAFDRFTPEMRLEKWAAVEVTHVGTIPDGMESLMLPGGSYAVFVHRGPAARFVQTLQFIFGSWLPTSGYQLTRNEHFEILAPTWRADDPLAEEEVWLPVESLADSG